LVDHHWLKFGSDKTFHADTYKFGFVYIITNLQTTKAYIGCKQYMIKAKFGEKESNWKVYTGSSKWLNQDIDKIGKKHFKFEIIAEYKNKRSLRYYELYYQMKYNVLASTLEGTDEQAYYNSRVGGKFFRPVESYEDPEWRKKLSNSLKNSEALKKSRKDPEYRKKLSESLKNSEALKKAMADPEYRKKLSESMKNSEAHKKAIADPEWRKKMSEGMKGNTNAKKKKKNARR
jgi:hypothetical protein